MSDGIVFSEPLTGLFTTSAQKHIDQETNFTYASLTSEMANEVASYLLAERPLYHPSTKENFGLEKLITPVQLAVLAQNKAYELTASEMEQRLFARGGSVGDARDVLDGMTAVERIEFLAKSKSWLCFEVRNTIKHQAHREAYQIVAKRMLKEERNCELVLKILKNLSYEDGWDSDLWSTVRDMLWGNTRAWESLHSFGNFSGARGCPGPLVTPVYLIANVGRIFQDRKLVQFSLTAGFIDITTSIEHS